MENHYFTGFYDESGKPVYEGDILERQYTYIRNRSGDGYVRKDKFAVEWSNAFNHWQFGILSINTPEAFFKDTKKVGSIYDGKKHKLSSKRPMFYKSHKNEDSSLF